MIEFISTMSSLSRKVLSDIRALERIEATDATGKLIHVIYVTPTLRWGLNAVTPDEKNAGLHDKNLFDSFKIKKV